jgi:hypothetical protein
MEPRILILPDGEPPDILWYGRWPEGLQFTRADRYDVSGASGGVLSPRAFFHLDHPDLARPQSVAVGQLEHSSVARVIDDLNDAKHSVLLY